MSTGYGWEGIKQIRATLLGARHVGCLSASVVAMSTWGAITNARPLPFTFYWCLAGDQSCSKGHAAHIKAKQPVMYAGRYISIRQVSLAGHCTFFASY